MFNNKDFKGMPNCFMFLATGWAYNALHDYSRVLGLPWITYSTGIHGFYESPSLAPTPESIEIMCIFLALGMCLSIKKCYQRIKKKEQSLKDGIMNYIKTFMEFGLVLIVMIIIFPIVVPYLRGWKSIF